MGTQEDPSKRKEFQKRTDADIDSFLARTEFSKTSSQQQPAKPAVEQAPAKTESAKTATAVAAPAKEPAEQDQEDQIRAARASRAEREAYQDVAVLRKKAHAFGHKAAKLFHKYKANEARAQRCSEKAVAFREKGAVHKDRAKDYKERSKQYEAELSGAATGKPELSPEALRTKMAQRDRRAARA